MHFADLHNHLLPGIDDGCRSMAETIRHLERFAAQGVAELVMTPHVAQAAAGDHGGLERRMAKIQRAFDQVVERCSVRDDLPALHLGQELFTPDETHLEALLHHPSMGFGDTNFLLVEFGFGPLTRPDAVIQLAVDRGFRVIIAHPERYAFGSMEQALECAQRWVDAGAFLQVNVGSLSGYYEGWAAGSRGLGWRMLEAGVVHLLASDDHGDERPQLQQPAVMQLISENFGEFYAEQLLSLNPLRVLRGEAPRLLKAASPPIAALGAGDIP